MSDEVVLQRTPLYEIHKALGGKIVPFAGWELPVQYSGVIAEHHAVRERAGLFDVSHMGEVMVEGPEAEALLQDLTCNDLSTLVDGKAQYSALLNDIGGVIDDIIIYRMSPTAFFVCVNASNSTTDFDWISKNNKRNARVTNLSKEYGQIALQGPRSEDILRSVKGGDAFCALTYFHFAKGELEGIPVIVARTGYTGEDGFEIFSPTAQTPILWNKVLAGGADKGLIPCGLGARDSLRLEACYPLHGHELSPEISALESGLGWIVKFGKSEFIGKAALAAQKEKGVPRALVGIFLDEPGIARQSDKVFAPDGKEIGVLTSGTKTPTVNRSLGIALVKRELSTSDSPLFVEVRGKKIAGHVVPKPFYSRKKE